MPGRATRIRTDFGPLPAKHLDILLSRVLRGPLNLSLESTSLVVERATRIRESGPSSGRTGGASGFLFVLPIASVIFAGALFAMGCEDETIRVGPPAQGSSTTVTPPPVAAAEVVQPDAGVAPLPPEMFVETDTNRDPFRSFMEEFKIKAAKAPQREVVMPTTSIEEMHLIAVITGVPRAKAMFVDPLGVGHVVERGKYVGQPEVVTVGGSEAVPLQLNWRVERIRAANPDQKRPAEVVLTREDPTAPNRPPLTRIIPLSEGT